MTNLEEGDVKVSSNPLKKIMDVLMEYEDVMPSGLAKKLPPRR